MLGTLSIVWYIVCSIRYIVIVWYIVCSVRYIVIVWYIVYSVVHGKTAGIGSSACYLV